MAQPYSDASVDAFVKHELKRPLDCIIVGSGVSGLTTASLLVQAGISVLVLERSTQAGGATHGFKESGFDFEIGLQEVGSQIWLGAESKDPYSLPLTQACNGLVKWKKFNGDKSYVIHLGEDGKEEFPVCDTWDQFRRDLMDKFPAEQVAIDKFHLLIGETRRCGVDWILSRLPNHTVKSSSWLFASRHAEKSKAGKRGAVENIERFRALALKTVDQVFDEEIKCTQELKYLLTFLWAKMGLPPRVGSWGAFALLCGQFMFDGLAFPVGGAPALERAMIEVIERTKLGRCFVDCKVQRIVCESNVCVGVQLESGKELRAKKVVSSIGAVNTYERLVPVTMAEYVRVPVKALKELKYSSYSVLQVFYGFEGNSDQLGLSSATHWFLPTSPVNDHTDNAVRYLLDPSFSAPFPYVHVSFPSAKKQDADSNKSTAVVFAAAHYDWFKGMQPDDVERCAEEIVSRLSKQLFEKFPQLADKIRFAELATPLSLEFHLGSNRGAMLGLGHSPSRFEQEWLRPQSPIKNLVLGGQDMLTASVVNSSVGGYMAARTAFPEEMLKHFPDLL